MCVNALKSGEFTQGRLVLRSPNGNWCCLGVLCELYRRDTGNGEWKGEYTCDDYSNSRGVLFEISKYSTFSQLVKPVTEWAGLDSNDPTVYDGTGNKKSLAALNDARTDWNTLAGIIERNL